MDTIDTRVSRLLGVRYPILQAPMGWIARSRLAGDPPDVHIAPRLGHIGLLEFDRAAEAIREGEAAVERKRHELADALRVLAQSAAGH